MRTRIAGLVLAISALMLVGVGLSLRSGGGEPRADLIGPVATTPSSTSVTTASTTTAPTDRVRSGTTRALPAGVLNVPPRRLSIPTIGVDVPVVSVGLAPDGSMEIPGASEAGWYRFGPTPGSARGSAVIAAHVDYNGAAGPFFDLRRLEVGDTMTTTDRVATVRRFVVTERFQVAKGQLPVDDLFRSDGAPTLTLITCGGEFDTRARHYQDNIVIRAVPA